MSHFRVARDLKTQPNWEHFVVAKLPSLSSTREKQATVTNTQPITNTLYKLPGDVNYRPSFFLEFLYRFLSKSVLRPKFLLQLFKKNSLHHVTVNADERISPKFGNLKHSEDFMIEDFPGHKLHLFSNIEIFFKILNCFL